MSTAGTSDRHLCCCLSFSGGNQSDMCDFQVKFQHVSTNYFMSDCRLLSGKKRAKAKDVDVEEKEKAKVVGLAKAEEGDVVRCRLMYQSLKILLREQYVVV